MAKANSNRSAVVIDLATRRAVRDHEKKQTDTTWRPGDPELSRAFLYAGVNEDGEVRWNIDVAEDTRDIPFLLAALHVMSIDLLERLTGGFE